MCVASECHEAGSSGWSPHIADYEPVERLVEKIRVKEEARTVKSAIGWMAGLVAIVAAAWAVRDYSRWRSLGPGGLPANRRGWMTMTRFRFVAQDGLNVKPLEAALGASDDLRSWIDVRRRVGNRPTISPYPVPHRQLDQLPDEKMRRELGRLFDRSVLQHAEEVQYLLSHFEKRHLAITLKNPAGKVGDRCHAEIAHIHPSDNSMHMILSPSDATAAIGMGWAQRHGLAGIAVGLPSTYVMVYAPRNEDDLRVVAELLEAAIAYAMQSSDKEEIRKAALVS